MNTVRYIYKRKGEPNTVYYLFDHEYLGYLRKGIQLERVS